MDEHRRRGIRTNLESKSTDELRAVWAARNGGEWTTEAIEIAQQLLLERGASLEPGTAEAESGGDRGSRPAGRGRRYRRYGALAGVVLGTVIGVAKALLGGGSGDVVWDAAGSAGMFSVFGAILGGLFGGFIQGYKGEDEP
jgi:hypothetical protein